MCKIWPQFSTQSPFTRCRSETMQYVCQIKHERKAQMIDLSILQVRVVLSTLLREPSIAISRNSTRQNA